MMSSSSSAGDVAENKENQPAPRLGGGGGCGSFNANSKTSSGSGLGTPNNNNNINKMNSNNGINNMNSNNSGNINNNARLTPRAPFGAIGLNSGSNGKLQEGGGGGEGFVSAAAAKNEEAGGSASFPSPGGGVDGGVAGLPKPSPISIPLDVVAPTTSALLAPSSLAFSFGGGGSGSHAAAPAAAGNSSHGGGEEGTALVDVSNLTETANNDDNNDNDNDSSSGRGGGGHRPVPPPPAIPAPPTAMRQPNHHHQQPSPPQPQPPGSGRTGGGGESGPPTPMGGTPRGGGRAAILGAKPATHQASNNTPTLPTEEKEEKKEGEEKGEASSQGAVAAAAAPPSESFRRLTISTNGSAENGGGGGGVGEGSLSTNGDGGGGPMNADGSPIVIIGSPAVALEEEGSIKASSTGSSSSSSAVPPPFPNGPPSTTNAATNSSSAGANNGDNSTTQQSANNSATIVPRLNLMGSGGGIGGAVAAAPLASSNKEEKVRTSLTSSSSSASSRAQQPPEQPPAAHMPYLGEGSGAGVPTTSVTTATSSAVVHDGRPQPPPNTINNSKAKLSQNVRQSVEGFDDSDAEAEHDRVQHQQQHVSSGVNGDASISNTNSPRPPLADAYVPPQAPPGVTSFAPPPRSPSFHHIQPESNTSTPRMATMMMSDGVESGAGGGGGVNGDGTSFRTIVSDNARTRAEDEDNAAAGEDRKKKDKKDKRDKKEKKESRRSSVSHANDGNSPSASEPQHASSAADPTSLARASTRTQGGAAGGGEGGRDNSSGTTTGRGGKGGEETPREPPQPPPSVSAPSGLKKDKKEKKGKDGRHHRHHSSSRSSRRSSTADGGGDKDSKRKQKEDGSGGGSRRSNSSTPSMLNPQMLVGSGGGPELVSEGPTLNPNSNPKTPKGGHLLGMPPIAPNTINTNNGGQPPTGTANNNNNNAAVAAVVSPTYVPFTGKQLVVDIRSCSPMTSNVNIVHPFVRVWVLNGRTGQSLAYGSDCSLDGRPCGVTFPFDIRSRKCRAPQWHYEICFDLTSGALSPENDPVVFFELMDFGQYAITGSWVTERFPRYGGLYPIGWGFYRLFQQGVPHNQQRIAHNTAPLQDTHIQLFSYPERRSFWDRLNNAALPSYFGHAAQRASGPFGGGIPSRIAVEQKAEGDGGGAENGAVVRTRSAGAVGAADFSLAPVVFSVFADPSNRKTPFPVGMSIRLSTYGADSGDNKDDKNDSSTSSRNGGGGGGGGGKKSGDKSKKFASAPAVTFVPRPSQMTPYEYALEEALQYIMCVASTGGGDGNNNSDGLTSTDRMNLRRNKGGAGGPGTSQVYGPDGVLLRVKTHSKFATMDYTRRRDERALPPNAVIHDETVAGTITAVALCPENRLLAIATLTNFSAVITVYDIFDPSFAVVASLKGHVDRIHSLAFSSDSQYLASGSSDKTAKVWNLANLPLFVRSAEDEMTACIATFSRGFSVYGAVFMGNVLVVGGYDTRLHVWTVPQAPLMQLYSPAEHHQQQHEEDAAASPNNALNRTQEGRYGGGGGGGGPFHDFSPNGRQQQQGGYNVQTVPHATASIVFLKSTDNNKLWSIDSAHQFVHWRADINHEDNSFETLQVRRRLECPGAATADIRGSTAVISCPSEQCVVIVDIRTFTCVHRIHTGKRTSFVPAALMPDGKLAVVGASSGKLLAWECASGALYTEHGGYGKAQVNFPIDHIVWGSNQVCVVASAEGTSEAGGAGRVAVLGRPRKAMEVVLEIDPRAADFVRSMFGGEVVLTRTAASKLYGGAGGGGGGGGVGGLTTPQNNTLLIPPALLTNSPAFTLGSPKDAGLAALSPASGWGGATVAATNLQPNVAAMGPPAKDRKGRMDQILGYWNALVKGRSGSSRGAGRAEGHQSGSTSPAPAPIVPPSPAPGRVGSHQSDIVLSGGTSLSPSARGGVSPRETTVKPSRTPR